jgi:starvation-inducible DNA-binding protein
MSNLHESMKKVLANTFSFYLKAQKYHWNVEGPNFHEYHEFLKNLYEEVQASVDTTAEQIRALDVYAPGSLSEFFAYSDIKDETGNPMPQTMMMNLKNDNDTLIRSLTEAANEAEAEHNRGLVNFLEGRIDVHAKHGWMLRSFSKSG